MSNNVTPDGGFTQGIHARYDAPVKNNDLAMAIHPDDSPVKQLQDAHGTVEINANGTTIHRAMTYNPGEHRAESGSIGKDVLSTARTSAGRPVVGNPSDDDIVNINGVETTVGGAKQAGLLSEDVGGRTIEVTEQQIQRDAPVVQPATKPLQSFMGDVGKETIGTMVKALGTEQADAIMMRCMAHMTKVNPIGEELSGDAQQDGAVKAFMRETGADPEQAEKILAVTLNDIYRNGVDYLSEKVGTKDDKNIIANYLDSDNNARGVAYQAFYQGDRETLKQVAFQLKHSPKFNQFKANYLEELNREE